MEAPTDLYELTISGQDPTCHVNLIIDAKVISHSYPTASRSIKGPLPFRKEVRDHFPLSPCELLEFSSHPIVTTVHLQYQTVGCRPITSMEGPQSG
jgi:hypothetical protein